MKKIFILVAIFLSLLMLAYVPPVLKTWLNSTFGELRLGFWPHFHMGVDFSTWEGNPKIGIKILSVDDGYVDRIVIDPDDLYGCTIVLSHRNGYKTLYAHLAGFSKNLKTSTGADISAILQDFINRYAVSKDVWKDRLDQMRLDGKEKYGQAFEAFTNEDSLYPLCFKEGWAEKPRRIVIKFPKDEIKVRQGQVVAYSGESGNVQGPHCHFEVRDQDERFSYDPFSIYPDILRWIDQPVRNSIVLLKVAIDGKMYDYSPNKVYEFSGDYPKIAVLAFSDYAVRGYSYRLGLRGLSLSLSGRTSPIYEVFFDRIPMDEMKKAFLVYDEKLSSLRGEYNAWYDLYPKGEVSVAKYGDIPRFPDKSTVVITLRDYFGNTKNFNLNLKRK